MVLEPAALAAVAAVDGRSEAPAAAVAAAADATETTLAVEAAGELHRNSDEHPTEGGGSCTATVYEPTSVAGVEAIPPAGAGGPPAGGPVSLREAHSMDKGQPSSDTVWHGISWVNMGVNGTTREYYGIFRRSFQRSQCFISRDKARLTDRLGMKLRCQFVFVLFLFFFEEWFFVAPLRRFR